LRGVVLPWSGSAFQYRFDGPVLVPELPLIQSCVQSAQLQQLSMRSFLHNSAPVEHHQPVGPAHRAEAVRYDQSGPAHKELG
jgi:hypothetical protein